MMNTAKILQVELCTKCLGTGKLRVGNLQEMHNHDIVTCHYCEGEGSWIKSTTIEYFKKTQALVDTLIPLT